MLLPEHVPGLATWLMIRWRLSNSTHPQVCRHIMRAHTNRKQPLHCVPAGSSHLRCMLLAHLPSQHHHKHKQQWVHGLYNCRACCLFTPAACAVTPFHTQLNHIISQACIVSGRSSVRVSSRRVTHTVCGSGNLQTEHCKFAMKWHKEQEHPHTRVTHSQKRTRVSLVTPVPQVHGMSSCL